MAKSREIKKRMKAVANIRRITKTMQMIATSKFARSQQRAMASKPYTANLFRIVSELAAGEGMESPLLKASDSAPGPELTLVITSDRGLCGPYNGNVIRTAIRHFRASERARDGHVEVVGKKGANALKFNRITVARHHTHFGDKPKMEDVAVLADEFIAKYVAGEVSAVRVVYMRYISAGRQAPEMLQLLPFQPPKKAEGEEEAKAGMVVNYEFSPDANELLNHLLPAAVRAMLYQAFNDAIVSENVARMVAMKAATDNAGKMGKRLNRAYNRARQSQITTELTEIISGAAALE